MKTIDKFNIIHESKKNRIYFRNIYILWLLILILIYIIAGLLLGQSVKAVTNPNGFVLKDDIGSILCFTFGLIIFFANTALTIWSNCFIVKYYKASRKQYLASEDFKQKQAYTLKQDLTKQNKKQIKWLFKLGYIDKQKYNEIISINRDLKENQEILKRLDQ